MAEICCGVVADGGDAPTCDMQKPRFKRQRVVREEETAGGACQKEVKEVTTVVDRGDVGRSFNGGLRYGACSVCGRRRDMEDTVAVCPYFFRRRDGVGGGGGGGLDEPGFHFFAVYDGHGCSHVAQRCKERLHELVKQELKNYNGKSSTIEWKSIIEKSFMQMDKEVMEHNKAGLVGDCRCELQAPHCDAVGSAAVVAIITPDKIIVANCGDSRAVLYRDSKVIPLSIDHKPDRPDELKRIEEAGGRVIYWDGPRVLGVLALSRAIGDNFLKPYVSSEPEITITDRTPDDNCLILGSDGLWDVVTNETACGVAKMCLHGKKAAPPQAQSWVSQHPAGGGWREMAADKACSDASVLLTKLALTRHTADNISVVVVDLHANKTV